MDLSSEPHNRDVLDLDQSLNSSMMIADLDVSKLDARAQLELSNLLENKDRLILEKSEKHKAILQDYALLKEQFIIKETENERLRKSLADVKVEIKEYRDKTKAQHEDIVTRLKMTEETVSEMARLLTSASKFVSGLAGQLPKALSDCNKLAYMDFEAFVEPYHRDLDSSVRAIIDKQKTNPKRLMAYLEEARNAYNKMKDKSSSLPIQQVYDEIVKTRGEEKQARASIRQSLRMQSQRGASDALPQKGPSTPRKVVITNLDKEWSDLASKLNKGDLSDGEFKNDPNFEEKLKDLTDSVKNLSNEVLLAGKKEKPGKAVVLKIADFIFGQNDFILTCLDSLPSNSSNKASQVAPSLKYLSGQLLDRREKLQANLQSSINTLQFDLDQLTEEQFEADVECKELFNQLCEIRDKVEDRKTELEFLNRKVGRLSEEVRVERERLNEVELERQRANGDLLIEQGAYFEARRKGDRLQDEIKMIEERTNFYTNQTKEKLQQAVGVDKQLEYSKAKLSDASKHSKRLYEVEKADKKDRLANWEEVSPIPKAKGLNDIGESDSKSLQSKLQGESTPKKIVSNSNTTPSNLPGMLSSLGNFLEILSGKLSNQSLGASSEPTGFSSISHSSTVPTTEDISPIEQLLSSIISNLSSSTSPNLSQAQQALTKKNQGVSTLQTEERALREEYLRAELKLELARQKTLQINSEIDKLKGLTDRTERDIEAEQREFMVRARQKENLHKKSNNSKNPIGQRGSSGMQEMKELKDSNFDEEERIGGLSEPLLANHSLGTISKEAIEKLTIKYWKVCLACAIPVLITYFLLGLQIKGSSQ